MFLTFSNLLVCSSLGAGSVSDGAPEVIMMRDGLQSAVTRDRLGDRLEHDLRVCVCVCQAHTDGLKGLVELSWIC